MMDEGSRASSEGARVSSRTCALSAYSQLPQLHVGPRNDRHLDLPKYPMPARLSESGHARCVPDRGRAIRYPLVLSTDMRDSRLPEGPTQFERAHASPRGNLVAMEHAFQVGPDCSARALMHALTYRNAQSVKV